MPTLTGVPQPEAGLGLSSDGLSFLRALSTDGNSVRANPNVFHVGDYGGTLDGVANDTAALVAAMTACNARVSGGGYPTGGGIVTTGGLPIKTSGDVTVLPGCIIDLGGATWKLTNTTDTVELSSNSMVQCLTISALGITGYVGPMLLIDDDGAFDRLTNKFCGGGPRVRLEGPGQGTAAAGTGLLLHGNGGDGVTGIEFPYIKAYNFDRGIHLWAENSWVNGNKIHADMFGCKKFFHTESDNTEEVNGNVFTYFIQPNTDFAIADWAIKDEGVNNQWRGVTWDWGVSGADYAVIFEATASDYILEDQIALNYVKENSADGQKGGYIRTLSGLYRPFQRDPMTPGTTENSSYTGSDDCLAFADEYYTVTTSGDAWTSLKNAFRQGDAAATCTLTGTGSVIKIDFGAAKTYLFGAGALFGFGAMPSGLTIAYSTDDVSYTTIIDAQSNADYEVARIGKSFLAGTFRYLRYTFSGSGAITLQRLFAYSASLEGTAWLSRTGSRYRSPAVQFTSLQADNTLSDVNTAQNLFSSSQDEFTLASDTTYVVDAEIRIDRSAGTTAHTISLLFGGTRTLNSLNLWAVIANPDSNGLASSVGMREISSASAVTITASNNSANETLIVTLRGLIRVTTGGTFIPQVQYSAAPGGAPTVKKDSSFRLWPIGTAAVTAVGNIA